MKQIQLSQGKFATVDDSDYPLLADYKWCYKSNRNGTQGYTVRHVKVDGHDQLCYLHRSLMKPGEEQEVIFSNHDRLDCRRENLLVVSHEEARQHHRVRSDSKSGVKGVRFHPESNTWSAYVYRHGHCYHIGSFGSQEAASAAYEAELKKENPTLHTAPQPIERSKTGPDQQEGVEPPSLSA